MLSSVMQFRLNHKQVVSVTPLLRFRQYSEEGRCYSISLNQNQFYNLDDLLFGYDSLTPLQYYPLGEGLWLRRKKSHISISSNHTSNTFSFNPTSWLKYRRFVHSEIKNIFYHGVSYHHQSYANYESGERFQRVRQGTRLQSHYKREKKKKRKDHRSHTSRGCISNISEAEQIVYRSTRDAANENEKRSKCADISRRHGTDSRRSHRRRGGRDEARIRLEIEEGEVDAELESDADDDKKLGYESANVEGNSSPQYQLE